ncbi:MAG: hypothetical protein ACREQ5_31635 [Candidatus Dormibacteria bacterium]
MAQYLSDPKMVQQGINIMRKAGATNAMLRRLAIAGGAAAGGLVNSGAE